VKRYAFGLAQVLRVRRIEEDRAAAGLAAARLAAAAAEERVDGRRQALAGMAPPGRPAPAGAFLAWHDGVGRAGDAFTAAGIAHAGAQATVGDRRAEWSAAAMRVAALERLDDRRRQSHTAGARRVEAARVDDLVASRHRGESR
jgi:flagellar protein FliJ